MLPLRELMQVYRELYQRYPPPLCRPGKFFESDKLRQEEHLKMLRKMAWEIVANAKA